MFKISMCSHLENVIMMKDSNESQLEYCDPLEPATESLKPLSWIKDGYKVSSIINVRFKNNYYFVA